MTDTESLVKIKVFIEKIVRPTEEEWRAFEEILQIKKLKKKELLLKEGQICTFIAFLNSGVLREYSYQNDKEITVDFVGGNQFTSDYQSFILRTPSKQYLEALTDVDLIILQKEDVDALYDQYKIWERFGRLIIERVFCTVEAKRKSIIATTHEEQYRNFVDTYPDIIRQVPQYYIASYLGLTPEHLSRLRKKS